MKKVLMMLFMALLVVAFVSGCAKKPETEIAGAKAAIDGVVADGGEKFAKDETKALQGALSAALAEVETQDKKFFKNFDEAKKQLAKITADAAALKADIPARKEKAKNDAVAAQGAAVTALDAAKSLLKKAPMGKDARADIEALKADIAGLDAEMANVATMIGSEDYFAAADKANLVSSKATEVSNQIKAAIEKFSKKKKGKK